ncbi:hypothetical protein LPMP_100070 [Leishmania panamensis]|uniref:Srp40 C-terminal domain-containing protein n=1 Tax=Leishmania panamensis TaxID=5679 RepID=A0A088S3K9_LEIPA|nr:hypothetical protein LPMP_100070 [Leishmania panamensis]AIN96076.1 hypothetical protein LPMP_100070 [Leishmania panamensis]
MSHAVDYLVAEYLAEEHPSVARALRKDAPSRFPFGKRNLQEVVMAYCVQKTSPAAVDNNTSYNYGDGAHHPPQKAANTLSPTPIPKPAVEKAQVANSNHDDESVKKPSTKKTSPKVAPNKAAVDTDSSDDTEHVPKNSASGKKPAAPHATEAPARKAARMESEDAAQRTPHHLNENGTFRRFQRIDPTKVTFHADVLRDNRPGEEHLVLRQNQEMMRTKGKGFNKLKQKNKGKFYGAGVDFSVRAYQFPDSDDE